MQVPARSNLSNKSAEALEAKRAFSISKTEMSLDYIFGRGTSRKVNFNKLDFVFSRKTGRVRHALEKGTGEVLFTFRTNGSIAPTVLGARVMLGVGKAPKKISRQNFGRPRFSVTVLDGVSDFVAAGKTVFCKHVVACHRSLRPGEDVIILNEEGKLLGVGTTTVSASSMKQFKRGVAVKVREGINSKVGSDAIA